jgi:predicted DCC family thiol-disulfide oxidoreductase YuxK
MPSAALKAREAFSYRRDISVPRFDDANPIVFMDGLCTLCTAAARLICRFDRRGEIRISPIGGDLAHAVLGHYGLDPTDPASWLYLEDGKAYASMEAIVRVGRRLGGWCRCVEVLRLLPSAVQESLYRHLARHRYRLFGRQDLCAAPDPELRRRLLL